MFPEPAKDQRWWAWHGTGPLLLGEYVKYVATLLCPLFVQARPLVAKPIEAAAQS